MTSVVFFLQIFLLPERPTPSNIQRGWTAFQVKLFLKLELPKTNLTYKKEKDICVWQDLYVEYLVGQRYYRGPGPPPLLKQKIIWFARRRM